MDGIMDLLIADKARPDKSSRKPAIPPPPPRPRVAGNIKDANYPPPSATPTQEGPRGIRYDFNLGARLLLPQPAEGAWRVCLRALDSGNILFETENQGAFVNSTKRWFVRFRIEVSLVHAGGVVEPVFTHDYDARGRETLIQFPIGTLGDTLAWFGYAARFAERHGCRLTCALSGLIIPILEDAYPDIAMVTHQEAVDRKLAEKAYASYCLGLFFDDKSRDWQPVDFRHVGLHRTAGYILGVDPVEARPALALPDESRPIAEPYVCIGVQSSSGAKYWNNPYGWAEVIAFLKARGYRVICIDQKAAHGFGLHWTHIPHGVEDQTGDRPLAERARWLRHAAAFIGLSSGLAWLAWAAGCPVVLISGFTHADNEFDTPYRVINYHACTACWNDPAERFDHKDFLWCPRHAGTPRQFECTRLITAHHVISAIKRIPDVAARLG
jgi:autotransporter strand-loop-strand O-heptosyltransferase